VKTLHRTLTIICCLAAALLISWKLLHQSNFIYSFWYTNLDIESHIAKFAPQNRMGKSGFERTDYEQRVDLFRAIGDAVNNSGEGLRTLSYQAHPNAAAQTFLTDAEATHLEDVANLIDKLEPMGWAAAGLLVLLIITAVMFKVPLPGLGVSLVTLLILSLVLALVIILVGPQEVFQFLHEAVFPEENEWFFYYQDSLMTTLMKAPDIFYAIGAVWAGCAALAYVVMIFVFRLLDRTKA